MNTRSFLFSILFSLIHLSSCSKEDVTKTPPPLNRKPREFAGSSCRFEYPKRVDIQIGDGSPEHCQTEDLTRVFSQLQQEATKSESEQPLVILLKCGREPHNIVLKDPLEIQRPLEIWGEKVDGSQDCYAQNVVSLDGFLKTPHIIVSGYKNRVKIHNLTFVNGYNSELGGGSIILNSFNTLHLSNTIFWNNYAQKHSLGRGGAIIGLGNTQIYVERSTFLNNKASLAGGAIAASGYLSVLESYFAYNEIESQNKQTNQQKKGGAIFLDNITMKPSESNKIEKTFFLKNRISTQNNSIETYGGAIHINHGYTKLIGNMFVENQACHGGAISTENVLLQTKQNIFEKNQSKTKGGALYIGPGTLSEIKNDVYYKNQIDINTKMQGGGIYVSDTAQKVLIESSFLILNQAGEGAGIYEEQGTIPSRDNSHVVLNRSFLINPTKNPIYIERGNCFNPLNGSNNVVTPKKNKDSFSYCGEKERPEPYENIEKWIESPEIFQYEEDLFMPIFHPFLDLPTTHKKAVALPVGSLADLENIGK